MRRLGAGRPDSGNSYEDLFKHPFFDGINWETVSTDSMPYDTKKLSDILKKTKYVDIFESDTFTTDASTRQSEVDVVLKNAEDFEMLFEK